MSDSSQECVAELVAAASEFVVGLRMRDGVSEDAFQRLSSALRSCASSWEGIDEIPRRAANVLVDIFPATESSAHLYDGEERNRIQEMALELHELIQECVTVDDQDA